MTDRLEFQYLISASYFLFHGPPNAWTFLTPPILFYFSLIQAVLGCLTVAEFSLTQDIAVGLLLAFLFNWIKRGKRLFELLC